MEPYLWEWGSAILRWLHIIAGMAWIGASFFFMHLDALLKRRPDLPEGVLGSSWQVHGGGFYEMRKWTVAPPALPPELVWHKWQAYWTWISGALLLAWIYYAQAELYLIDPAVLDIAPPLAAAIGVSGLVLGWLVYDALCKSRLKDNDAALLALLFLFVVGLSAVFAHVFSGRAAMLHTGAVLGTVMTGNVFFVIIPNQRIIVADLKAGRAPDPALGKAGKQRSTHNNYITLPVVFMMIANHYPLAWSRPWVIPLMVALVTIAGALVRVFYNLHHAGRGSPWWAWGAAGAAMAAAIALSIVAAPGPNGEPAQRAAPQRPVPAEVADIMLTRCSMCHMPQPVWAGIAAAPKGVLLDTDAAIARQAEAIRLHAVLTRSMPPNNLTGMTDDERRVLAAWLSSP
ncbi:urate hydroxylase PuuD [Elioraea thermophila]|uniref:urate hydroxylase PuuD n=1 Tax=Elioraea thermophila TaxID=2185104 RepID=UPI000DF3BD15|nr:urate hydroxylase PuuD [Elioraea thermophila]